jgi:hypothetical protein
VCISKWGELNGIFGWQQCRLSPLIEATDPIIPGLTVHSSALLNPPQSLIPFDSLKDSFFHSFTSK